MKAILFLCLFLFMSSQDYKNPMEDINVENVDRAISSLPNKMSTQLDRMTNEMKDVKSKMNLNEAESAYFIFKWVTKNIQYDCYNTMLNPYGVQRTAEGTYMYGRAAGEGFSALYAKFADALGIPVNTTSGYIKTEDLNNIGVEPTNPGHYWNYVKINSKGYLLDTAWASGYCNQYTFVPNYKEYYFCPNPQHLIYSHYPQNSDFQLLNKTITLKEFALMPYLSDIFFGHGFKSISPNEAIINAKEAVGTISLTYEDKGIPNLYIQVLYKAGYGYYQELRNAARFEGNNGQGKVTYMLRNRGEYILRIYYYEPGSYAYASLLTIYKIVYM